MRSMVADFLRSEGYKVSECPLATQALAQFARAQEAFQAREATRDGFPRDASRAGMKEAIRDEAILLPGFQADSAAIDCVISDLNMPEMSGIEFIDRFRQAAPDVPIILITAFGSIETAVEAIRAGAFDYTTKPFKLSEMSVTVARALKFRDLRLENARLQAELEKSHSFARIIGKSPGMQDVFDLIRRVANATANVLIMGESGTGKERVARAIHEQGNRRAKRFVAINCTAIPESLLESELFGHAKGSFTGAAGRKRGLFEEADGGTIFLDEIGDMDLALQAKLLRVLQERRIRAVGDTVDREVDVRIIAATHKDLKAAIRTGGFREDLYYRLSVIPIVIPPLRHRPEDIPLLTEHFLKKYAEGNSSNVKGLTREAMARLLSMPWEGNVRELENLIERAVVLARGELISLLDLGNPASAGRQGEVEVESFFTGNGAATLPTLEEIEKRYMKFVLDKTGGRKEKAAQILGVNRRTLYRKERDYGFVSGIAADLSEPDRADDASGAASGGQ
jgi:DNA-binding NtrC family response regulator